jgi:hypothetical protein
MEKIDETLTQGLPKEEVDKLNDFYQVINSDWFYDYSEMVKRYTPSVAKNPKFKKLELKAEKFEKDFKLFMKQIHSNYNDGKGDIENYIRICSIILDGFQNTMPAFYFNIIAIDNYPKQYKNAFLSLNNSMPKSSYYDVNHHIKEAAKYYRKNYSKEN